MDLRSQLPVVELLYASHADVDLVLVLSPNRPQLCLQHLHEAAYCRRAPGDRQGSGGRPWTTRSDRGKGSAETSSNRGGASCRRWGRGCLTAAVVDWQTPDRHVLVLVYA